MKRYLAFLLLASNTLFSQGNLKLSELESSNGKPLKFFSNTLNGDSYVFVEKEGMVLKDKLIFFSGLNKSASENINIDGSLIYAEAMGNNFVTISRTEKAFMAQKFNSKCKPEGSPVMLQKMDAYNWNKGVFFSKNHEYFALVYQIQGEKKDDVILGQKVFDKDLKLISSKEYKYNLINQRFYISTIGLTDNGEHYYTINYDKLDPSSKKNNPTVTSNEVKIYKADKTNSTEYNYNNLNSEKISVRDIKLNEKNSNIVNLTGYYFDQLNEDKTGLVDYKFDIVKNKMISENIIKFTPEQKELYKVKSKQPRSSSRGIGHSLESFIIENDNSTLFVSEESILQEEHQGPGFQYSNAILVSKVNSKGEIMWTSKIEKKQLTVGAEITLASISSFVYENKLHIFFGDTKKNYDEKGFFSSNEEDIKQYPGKDPVLVHVEIDVTDGKTKRKIMNPELESVPIPKLFNLNPGNNKIYMLFLNGYKIQIGEFSFN